MRFSNPSSRAFENGRLLGSAHTRSTRSAAAGIAGASSTIAISAPTLRQREHIDRAPFAGVVGEILGGAHEAERGGFVARVETAGDDGARPPADAIHDRDVLLAVGPAKTDRLADDPGARAELPQELPAACVERLE